MFNLTFFLSLLVAACNPNNPSTERTSFSTEKRPEAAPKPTAANANTNTNTNTTEVNKTQSADATVIATSDFAKLCSSGVKKTRLTAVEVPANTGSKCPFGQGDNLGMMEGQIAARIEKNFPLDIPKTHKICSMKAEALKQLMRYDDHLILTLNNNVLLASTTETSRFVDGANGFKQYDWSKIKGGTITDSPSYCGPGIICALPRTEARGDFIFSISDTASPKIFAPLVDSELKFGLILTGDNDPSSDCQLNTPLTINLSYDYVE
jgi:hypothetical protein